MGFQKKKYMVSSDAVKIVEHWNFFSILFYSLKEKKALEPIVLFNMFCVLVCALQLGDVLKFNIYLFSKSALLFLVGL